MLCKKSDYSDLSCYSLSADDWLCVDLRLFPVLFSLVPLKISRIKLRVLIKKLFTASITRKTGADAAASQQLLLLILHMAVKSCSRNQRLKAVCVVFFFFFRLKVKSKWRRPSHVHPECVRTDAAAAYRRMIKGSFSAQNSWSHIHTLLDRKETNINLQFLFNNLYDDLRKQMQGWNKTLEIKRRNFKHRDRWKQKFNL